ncbi:hypothetical protein [Azobacteroides phage ProJPt-Bp1]|uniref:Uncharacterized protein n=1 Tax=Azobacteroides phage ProJPt-Bp1 TaxID=1920526 RepID=A0A1V1FMZ7_9CAUD|nr:hypothetical protein KNT10_gp33 [Azobacteroides phage ProJPt-Bp1]BAX03430.1 hypothetical protein [Azobacteroides phage ProJPt-Bp1]
MYNPLHNVLLIGTTISTNTENTSVDTLTAGQLSLVFARTGIIVRSSGNMANIAGLPVYMAYKKNNGDLVASPAFKVETAVIARTKAYVPMTPRADTVTLPGTFAAGSTYTISLLLQMPDLPRPYTEFMVSMVSGGTFTTQDECAIELARLLNAHPVIKKAITATRAGAVITITEKIPDYDIMQRQRFVRNQYQIKATAKLAAANSQPTALVPASTAAYTPGHGAWQLVSDLEKRSQGRFGITNITEFPVTLPSTMTIQGRAYSGVSIQARIPDRDAANAPITRDIYIQTYQFRGDGADMAVDAAAGLTDITQQLTNAGF